MKTINNIFLLFCIVAVTGCATIPRYPDYIGDDAATLCGRVDPNPFNNNPNVTIMSIDGVRTPGAKCKAPLILKPGEYEVGVFVNILSNASFTVKASLEANKKYQIRGRYGSTWVGQNTYQDEGDKYSVYLLDMETEEKTPLEKITLKEIIKDLKEAE